jgi:hypothetical protein
MKRFSFLIASFVGATIAGILFGIEHHAEIGASAVAGQMLWCVFAAGFVLGRRFG